MCLIVIPLLTRAVRMNINVQYYVHTCIAAAEEDSGIEKNRRAPLKDLFPETRYNNLASLTLSMI